MYSKDELANIAADQQDDYLDNDAMIDLDEDFYDDSDDARELASFGRNDYCYE